MAIFKSTLFSEVRGSIAGSTFSRNGNAAYIRSRAIPTNPRTSAQTGVRANFSVIAAAWRSLTSSQRDAWRGLAQTIPYINSVGTESFYSGFQLFMKNNLALLASGLSMVDSASEPPLFPGIAITAINPSYDSSTDTTGLTVTITSSPDPADDDFHLMIYATPAFSPGKKFVNPSLYKLIDVDDTVESDSYDVATDYEAQVGSFGGKVGQSVAVKCRVISESTGFVNQAPEIIDQVVSLP